jgi:hypothetical protein
MTKTIYSLLLKVVGPPLTCFDPAKYVDSWMLRKCHSPTNRRNEVGILSQTKI